MNFKRFYQKCVKKEEADMVLFLLVSQMCNIRCKFCYQKSFDRQRLSDEVLYERLKPLYPRVRFLPIVGGEVTVVPGMKEYVRWIKENYPHIDIVIGTNGVAFDEDWLALTEKYHLLINYSLNAVKQETYDQILVSGDAKEIFGKINDHFHALLEIHNRSERPVVNEVSMVVTEDTASDVEAFIIKALAAGVNPMIRFNVEKEIEMSPQFMEADRVAIKLKYFCEDYITVTPWHNPNYETQDALIGEMRKDPVLREEKETFLLTHAKKKSSGPAITYIDYMPEGASCCPVIDRGLSVGFDGTVVPCYNLPNYVLGNIYYDTVEEILTGERLRTIRQEIHCGDYQYCFDRCPLNQNPDSGYKNREVKFHPLYERYFAEGNYAGALKEYEKIWDTPLCNARQKYEMAYCLHVTGTDYIRAERLYAQAFTEGFDEFWVKYNRCDLYIRMERIEAARNDIHDACKLAPDHAGARELFQRLSEQTEETQEGGRYER